MDFGTIIENIKDKFNSLKNKVLDFYEENKKLAILILSLIIMILVLLIVIIATSGKKTKKKQITGPELILTEPMLIPNSPEMPDDYTISRITQDKWTDEEADQWFTVPSEKEIDSLSSTNENMVNEILKATP